MGQVTLPATFPAPEEIELNYIQENIKVKYEREDAFPNYL